MARGVARALGWRYVDTGATYRAVTLAVLRAGVDPHDAPAVLDVARRARVELSTDADAPATRLNGIDVSAEIRGAPVTAAVSAVSAVPEVRTLLVALQRSLAGDAGAVVEGRDIAAVVLPDAAVKVYLDASAEERARRRAGDRDAGVVTASAAVGAPNPSAPAAGSAGSAAARSAGTLQATVAADLARRDALDSGRAASPLAIAPDAVVIDSSTLDAAAVVERVLELARAAGFVPVDADA